LLHAPPHDGVAVFARVAPEDRIGEKSEYALHHRQLAVGCCKGSGLRRIVQNSLPIFVKASRSAPPSRMPVRAAICAVVNGKSCLSSSAPCPFSSRRSAFGS